MSEALRSLLVRVHRANARRALRTPDAELERELHAATGCDERLAVYGSLAPAAANHREVEDLGGSWSRGEVRGHRALREWPAFTWDESAAPVAMQILQSPRLPSRWPRLDSFEGPDYCRILVLVRDENGRTAVANLYSAATPVAPS